MILFVFILLMICGYFPMIIRRYSLKSELINQLKIVMISDLHGTFYGKNQGRLIAKINKEKPDIILLVGDLTDEKHDLKAFEALLKGIRDYPLYYVYGNHEHHLEDDTLIQELIQKYHVHYMPSKSETLTIHGSKLEIIGIDDLKGYETLDDFLSDFRALPKSNHYTILLSHRPGLVSCYQQSNYDLVLCGHAHGGQWRIPFLLNGIYAPDERFFPKHGGGLYHLDQTIMIVSRGLARNLIPRFFNPPELVVIEIKK